ncbi:MAG TPA: uracil-DNA glycosylase [Ktedonobacterales bacterium]|jgi:uracil-DNA glycosylase|nr:uracil-DNA glycosylase [Ktedonobacterales bacterium]
MTREELLEEVAAETRVCTLCPLHEGAHSAVPGEGSARAEIMLIGEAPSYVDDRRGTPFSGPSGAFLDELLARAGLSRAEVFLTNIVKHRSPDSRELTAQEVTACAPYLTRQIAAINPILVVALGRGAAKRFFPRARITEIHGQAKLVDGRIVVAMYNPAAALHREELRQTVVDDFANALPAALAEARRLAAEGKLGQGNSDDGETFEQPSLF